LELLVESFIIYMFLVGTAYIKPRYRMAAALGMMLYELATREGTSMTYPDSRRGLFLCHAHNS
jgi:hypothetical protein